MKLREVRTFTLPVEVRQEGDRAVIFGYAARFNELSHDLGGFRENIQPGAFRDALSRDDVMVLYNHEPDHVLGRTGANTARVWEDKEGLRYEADADLRQTDVANLVRKLQRGDIKGSSFGFRIIAGDDEWEENEGVLVRTIVRVERLYDVGPVTFAAYPTASSGARSAADVLAEYRSINRPSSDGETWSQQLERLERRLKLA